VRRVAALERTAPQGCVGIPLLYGVAMRGTFREQMQEQSM